MARPGILLVCLTLALLLAATDGAAAERPTATVRLAGPEETTLTPMEDTPLRVAVNGRVACMRGFEPPQDLVVVPVPLPAETGDEVPIAVDPPEARVAWQDAPGEPGVHILNALLSFNVSAPVTVVERPVETSVAWLVHETGDGDDDRVLCHIDGYDLDARPHAVAFQVVPDESFETAGGDSSDEPPIRVVPILLAVGILAGMTAFAQLRERRRQR